MEEASTLEEVESGTMEADDQEMTSDDFPENAELTEEVSEEQLKYFIEKQEYLVIDTSEEFAEVFGDKNEFDSWDEFTTLLEEFQKKTGSSFKPRSASSVEYANERRISSQIPERFVYINVKMICVHFGMPVIRGKASRKSYLGKGCGAFMNVSYNRGALRITQSNLIHNNHPLGEVAPTPLRHLRAFTFSDDIDLIIAQEVLKCNPFEFVNGEKFWYQAVDNLKSLDERLANITPRITKKRIRFLVDKFLTVSHGRPPSEDDEMGKILYELDRTRKETQDNPPSRGRPNKGPGRPRKKRNLSPYVDDEEIEEEEEPKEGTSRKRGRPSLAATPSVNVSAILSFLKHKEDQDRKLRQQEIDLRKEELDLHKKEMELQKQRFELDKMERKAHLELINTQMRILESQTVALKADDPLKHAAAPVTEYTIVVDNNSQLIEAVPNLSVT